MWPDEIDGWDRKHILLFTKAALLFHKGVICGLERRIAPLGVTELLLLGRH